MRERIALIILAIILLIVYFWYLPKILNVTEHLNIIPRKGQMISVSFDELTKPTKKQIECLAENIYHESLSEPEIGKVAVAFVTLNRVSSPEYPRTICEVVRQKTGEVCQFSWICQGKSLTGKHKEMYNEIRELATFVYLNYERMKDPTYGALFYHADYVNPSWRNVNKTVSIGRHIFYTKKERT